MRNVRKLSNIDLQKWIGTLAETLSPKTISNIFSLLSSALGMFAPDFNIKVSFPERYKPNLYTPSDKDIERLINHISGKELEIAVLLSAFGPMRRGES